ncbi:MAG: uridine kinase [Clostridia bacterium]|nr:uridine kinase [Clostridia bacterium]
MNSLLIGICGGTGSGKTTLAQKVSTYFGDDVLLFSMDNYYKSNSHLSYEQRVKINYDHPNAFDKELLLSHVKALKQGQSVDMPTYDFSQHTRSNKICKVQAKSVIIIEGILLFAISELVELLDIKIFVDTDADVRILRRILRDVKDRGRSLDSVIDQYLQTVKPMHESFIEPSKKHADIIVPEGGFNQNAFEMITSLITKKLN